MALNQKKLDLTWNILTQCANDRGTITYGCLAKRIDVHQVNVGGQYLDPISVHCNAVCVPDLSALVVSKRSGLPTTFRHGDDVPVYQELVFAHKWEDVKVPRL